MTSSGAPPALRVLVVDDQPAVVGALRLLFELHDLAVETAASAAQALRAVATGAIGVVVQDMNLTRGETSGAEGAQLFRAVRQLDPDMPVLLITAWASLGKAVELTKEGAADYLAKPWDDERLVATVRQLLAARVAQAHGRRTAADEAQSATAGFINSESSGTPDNPDVAGVGALSNAGKANPSIGPRTANAQGRVNLCGLVVASEAMRAVVELALTVAPSDAPVVLSGPSGAGKEKIAEILHHNSPRRGRPLVRVNVGAIPLELAESELFGAEAGAYTGARVARIGHFEAADGGTLFLDELDAMPPAVQVKLLRVLQSGEIQRLGSSRPRQTDVRIVAASNADLERAVAEGRLRQDLLFRLDVVRIRVPGLTERPGDVLPLARHFLATLAPAATVGRKELSAAAVEALCRHHWPGNVRELANRIHRALLIGGPSLSPTDLGLSTATATASNLGSTRNEQAASLRSAHPHGASDPKQPDPKQPKQPAPLHQQPPSQPPDSRPLQATPPHQANDPDAASERATIEAELLAADGLVAVAARRLGLSRQALYRRMSRLGIALERRLRE